MRKTLSSLVVALVLLGWSGAVHAGSFQKGVGAFEAGDYAIALREFRDLAEQGDAEGQYFLGGLYNQGKGVSKNNYEAAKWWQLAAEQGYVDAQYQLGKLHEKKGQGVAFNPVEAAKWIRLAAEQGHADAQYNLGAYYMFGSGVPLDSVLSYMWFNISAASGIAKAAVGRDTVAVANKMTLVQIAEAQKMTREWMEEHPPQ